MDTEAGRSIHESFKAMEGFTENLQSLIDDLRMIVKQEIDKLGKYRPIDHKSTEESSLASPYGWLYTAESFSIPLAKKGPGKSKVSSYLSYQFNLIGGGSDVVGEPLLHVCFWEDSIELEGNKKYEPYYFSFDLDQDDEFQLTGNHLVTWETDDARLPMAWTYSIKLLSIIDKPSLHALAVAPAIELLALNDITDPALWRAKAIEAMPDSLLEKGIVTYDPTWFGNSASS